MKGLNLRELAESWIKIHYASEGSAEYSDNFWAYNQLSDLCYDAPEKCFEAIEMIRSLDNSDVILSNLAAGPMEDLLSNHGELLIGRIEKSVETDSQLRKLLGAVWQNSIPDSIWKRIQAIVSPSW